MKKFDMIKYPEPKQEYKVLVRCYTYNHSNYIEDALNGFAMQQTGFPFVCVVVDDASTDGEQEVIKAWMERECDMSRAEYIDITTSVVIIVTHKNNLSCTFAFYLLKQNLYGTDGKKKHLRPWREKCKYEALCEGDDYWIDPFKLQRQVDFLEKNKSFTLIGSNAKIVTNKGEFIKLFSRNESKNISTQELISKWSFPTAGILYRSFIIQHVPCIKGAPQGDIILQLTCAHWGQCYFEKDVVCVYRWLTPGSSTERVRKEQLDYYIRHYSMWVELNKYFKGTYNEYIQKKLREIRCKIVREKIIKSIPGLQYLRTLYRNLRGY